MGGRVLSIIALIVVGAMLVGLATHATGVSSIINSVTGFFGTGLNAELGQTYTPAPVRKGQM